MGRGCVLDSDQSLVSGPTSPRTKDEADSLSFISLLRAARTLGASGGSNCLLLRMIPCPAGIVRFLWWTRKIFAKGALSPKQMPSAKGDPPP